MKKFFLKLLGSNTGVSSRRLIALIATPFFLFASYKGAISDSDFKFACSIFSNLLLILLTYYSMTWETVKGILGITFNKKTENEETTYTNTTE